MHLEIQDDQQRMWKLVKLEMNLSVYKKEMNSNPQVSTSPPTEKREATSASAEGMCKNF
jgi:hypothetical protein